MDAAASLATRVRSGDRRAVARAISAVENDGAQGRRLLAELAGHPGHAHVLGITGPPGAGKSTLVNALVKEFAARGHSVGVLAVDPSSPVSGGAVLGDRIRMGEVHAQERVFIRSLATRGHLGGLTRGTQDIVAVLDAAGFDVVIVETVGTGQSEVQITSVAPVKAVVCPPGLGDDVQALKAGVLEIADVFVVNKADLPDAARTEGELRTMLALRPTERRPKVLQTVATSGQGIAALADELLRLSAGAPRRGARPAPAPPADAHPATPQDPASLLQRLARRDAYRAHLGLEFVEGGDHHATVKLAVRAEHLNFFGSCHGGAIFSLADTALGLACNSQGSIAALVDAHLTLSVGVRLGDVLTARAVQTSSSRKLAVYRIDVTRQDATLVASLTGTVYLTGKPLPAA
ncbi:MAG: methylmalonyl Co-A mutase-associated GTPase MeaB [Ramlibacter sp.]